MSLLRRAVVALMVVAFVGLAPLGCNTTKGAGEDIKDAGRAIEDAAD